MADQTCQQCGGVCWDGRPLCFRCRKASGQYDGRAATAAHVARLAAAYAAEGDTTSAARAQAHARRIRQQAS